MDCVVLGKAFKSAEEDLHWLIYAQTKNVHLQDWTNIIPYCFILFICGGPCHLSSFKHLIFLWEQLGYLFRKKTVLCISSFILLILKFWVYVSSPKLHSAPLRQELIKQNDDVTGTFRVKWRSGRFIFFLFLLSNWRSLLYWLVFVFFNKRF